MTLGKGLEQPERLFSIRKAAAVLELPSWKLARAARLGLIPTYRLYNSRRLVRLSEVVAVIDASRSGGDR